MLKRKLFSQIDLMAWPEHKWSLVLLAICVTETFVIQEITLNAVHQITLLHEVISPIIRLFLDLTFYGFLTLVLRTKALRTFFVLEAVVFIALMTYHQYFSAPLSISTVRSQLGEGIQVLSFALGLIDPVIATAIAVLCALKSFLAGNRTRPVGAPILASMTAGSYLAATMLCATWVDPLRNLATYSYTGSTGMTYGYFITWLGEALYQHDEALLDRAIQSGLQTGNADLVYNVQRRPLALHDRIVVLQIESLDYGLLDLRIDGKLIAPALTEFASEAKTLRVKALHNNGSADADFILLMNRSPSADVVTYKLAGYPFSTSPVSNLTRAGYITSAYHGASGRFFGRASAYREMGFSSIWFKEDILETGREFKTNEWGIQDCDLFSYVSDRLAEIAKFFAFVISVSSHGPFVFLDSDESLFFPKPTGMRDNYLNSMHYVDACFGKFLQALPAETTVIVYGDHSPGVQFRSDNNGATELVPFMIGSTVPNGVGHELIDRDDLTILDAAAYVWSLMEPAGSETRE